MFCGFDPAAVAIRYIYAEANQTVDVAQAAAVTAASELDEPERLARYRAAVQPPKTLRAAVDELEALYRDAEKADGPVADVDERSLPGESPAGLVARLARAKAQAVAGRFPRAAVIGADTIVTLEGEILGRGTASEVGEQRFLGHAELVALEQADNLYQLEKSLSYGDFGDPADPAAVGRVTDTLTSLGIEVDTVSPVGETVPGVVTARVLRLEQHPDAAKVQRVYVDAGDGEERHVWCGAFNMAEGDVVPLATLGTSMPNGMRIERRGILGIDSEGMLCAPDELGLGDGLCFGADFF